MSEAQLQKLQLERDALRAELAQVQSAVPPAKAAALIIAHCQNKSDPFSHSAGGGGQDVNEWVSDNNSGGGCCSTM